MSDRSLAIALDDLRTLHQLCREGRLYEVEGWIAQGKALQLAPEVIPKSARPRTSLQIALETGQHSLVSLLLRSGYRLELERYRPLDLALRARRWDLFDLLLESGGHLNSVEPYTVLNTYNAQLYERFQAAGYDLTAGHEMGSILGQGTSNRPLLGFVKRYRVENPKIQTELNIALGYHARTGNERGVALCLWAGADPHAAAPNPGLGIEDDPGSDDGEDRFIGWSAVEEAAREGHLAVLKKLGPDPARDNFDHLFQYAKSESVIAYLATIQPPKDLTSALTWHLRWMVDPFPWGSGMGSSGTVEKLLTCGSRWEESDPKKLAQVRWWLVKAREYELKSIFRHLRRPEICAPETLQELGRTPRMQERLLAHGLVKKLVSERERRREETARRQHEVARLSHRYDRRALYDQVWSQPVQVVAKSYGISGTALAKTCRKLRIPVPPRGYWARVRNGLRIRKPPLGEVT
jgi:hypothetical protein